MDQSENDIFNHHHHVREEKYVCRRGFRKKTLSYMMMEDVLIQYFQNK